MIPKLKPFDAPLDNIMCLLNEYLTSGYLYIMLTLTDYAGEVSTKAKNLSSWGLTMLTVTAVIINTLKAIVKFCIHIKNKL
jgi:hypothetical protein